MPRNLPWLAQTPSVDKTATSARSRNHSPEDLVDANLDDVEPVTSPRRKKTRRQRTPSTSPPPAPPDVAYMREGYHADDGYIMVEDELWSTAKLFTQHLHHAEYTKFKKLAASRGADVLDAIARPVDGRTEQSGSLKLQIEAKRNAKKIKAGIKDILGESDTSSGEEDDYMNDACLAGLMGGSSKPPQKLSALPKPQSNTRAAAGLAQSPRNVLRNGNAHINGHRGETHAHTLNILREPPVEEDSSTDDDDLDKPIKTERRGNKEDLRNATARDGALSIPDARIGTKDGKKPTIKTEPTSEKPKPSAASNFLAKRRAERERKEQEEKRKVKDQIEIPTFAI